ncbi:hypothetical protein A3A63_02755 [Candidatus Gottesmanbacteria bacterium RIFCSPLOWO2_01_FULL_46_9]|uniref:2,3-bisphosphoglycerate-dependent phosphoglycerate mutase n=1 Tax=Candidatus Gottesmanbacteria bacterium RIFCSPLOWO2_01_FULL_46_9 TaxID=1798394 RepID=A0A1F6B1L7_9BACT|nr:MAG: hypothetical protein A3A63_02755 [Candidatus Gottesmanbacteria bacterium RIFCSPLOWO2_01_FULL_46_9]
MEGILVLVRHGESEWNARNIWTGLTDIRLTQKGKDEAVAVASLLGDIAFDRAFTSELSRAYDSLRIMLRELHIPDLSVTKNSALNERDYGVYTGKNKAEIRRSLGDEEFLRLRRGWDYPIPKGESLKQVYARVIPYFDSTILPLLCRGLHVVVVAHGNSLRALIKKLDTVSDTDISSVELNTGEIVIFRVDATGAVVSRESRGT